MYETNAVKRKKDKMIRKKPSASVNRGSVKKPKLKPDFDFPPFDLFSFSGFLKVLVLSVFSAIREFAGKNKQYLSENGSRADELLTLIFSSSSFFSYEIVFDLGGLSVIIFAFLSTIKC